MQYVIRHRDTGLCLARHRHTQPTSFDEAATWSRFGNASRRRQQEPEATWADWEIREVTLTLGPKAVAPYGY